MKKQLWILAVLVVGVVALTGCGASNIEESAPQTLNRANWTQSQPAMPTPTATAFPKITIADVVTATAPNTPVPESAIAATATPPAQPVIALTATPHPFINIDESSPTGGIIVFQSTNDDIMLINVDGSGLHRLTNGIDPVFSPDGQSIAFVRWQGDSGSLWTMGVDGSGERQITGEIKQARHPSWSPDGTRIVVNLQHGGRLSEQKECYSLVGTTPEAILKQHFPWNLSPDDVYMEKQGTPPNLVPFLCWNNSPDPYQGLRVINVADGSIEDLAVGAYNYGAEWDTANDWRIISSSDTGLAQLDVNRNEQWALTDRREDRTPTFSPDGKYIAVTFNNNGHWDIHRLDAGGNGRMQLTETPLWVGTSVGDDRPWNNVAPAWSPDGTRIAFLSDRVGRWEIWVMNADGSNQQPMFSDAVNNTIDIGYNFVDERILSWR